MVSLISSMESIIEIRGLSKIYTAKERKGIFRGKKKKIEALMEALVCTEKFISSHEVYNTRLSFF